MVIGSSVGALSPSGEEAAARELEMAAELASKREIMLPRIFEALASRQVEPEGSGGEPEPLTLESERVLLRALELMEPGMILSYLESEMGSRSIGRRRAVIQFLGSAGRATDTLRLIGVALKPDERELEASIDRATRQALVSILRRDPITFGVLEGGFPVLRAEILPTVIEALGVVADPRGFSFLCTAAREHEALRLRVLEQVPAVGRSGEELLDIEMRGYARDLIHEERAGCRTAIRAAAMLRDDEAIPALIELLPATASQQEGAPSEEEPSDLEIAARGALRSMTGMSFESRTGWSRWYQAERAWMVTKRAAAFQKLSSSDHRQVAEALDAIAPHPLVREEFVSVLSDLLRTRPVEIRLLVCRAIQDSGAREAIPELVSALTCETSQVGVAAHRALQSLTGRDLPLDAEVWSGVARELGYPQAEAR